MKKQSYFQIAAIAALMFAFVSCGGDSNDFGGTPPSVVSATGVTLNKNATTLAVGDTEQLTAAIQPSNAANNNVTWSSSNNAVAAVSTTGLVTAQAVGTARITVTTQDGGRTAYCDVTVITQNISVTSVSLNQTAMSLVLGGAGLLTATIQPSNATNKNVAWTSGNSVVATVSTTGWVTAHTAGTALITVTTQDSGHTAVCNVTVSIPVTHIWLQPTISLTVGSTGQLAASILPSNATNKNVTWTSSNSAVATVSTTGLVTARAAGTARITVTTQDSGLTAYCDVTVRAASMSLNQTTMWLAIGGTGQLNATNRNITWSSNNNAVASVSNSGLVSAHAAGAARITATTLEGGYTAYCDVTVRAATMYVAGLTIVENSQIIPTLWVNGVPQYLRNPNGSSSRYNAEASSVFVSGGDVYVAGTSEIMGIRKAVLWVNGVPQLLSDANIYAEVTSVFVSGGDVYVAGSSDVPWYNGTVRRRATLWVNGVPQYLNEGNTSARASSVFVSGTDVYVAGGGYYNNSTLNSAMLWVNGVLQYLNEGNTNAGASSVFVSGTDVYVVGTNEFNTNTLNSSATLWVNGVPQYLTKGTRTTSAEARSVFVSGGDVFVAGDTFISGDWVPNTQGATLWVNGVPQYLNVPPDLDFPSNSANSVFVSGGDVFVTGDGGAKLVNGNIYLWRNTLWVNGVPQRLFGNRAEVGAVFIDTGGAVSSIWLNPTLTLETGQIRTLAPAILPINALNKSITWHSDRPGFASVDGAGKVTAHAKGTATITATTADGGYRATCAVTVL